MVFGDGLNAPHKVKCHSSPSLKALVTKNMIGWSVVGLAILYCNNSMETCVKEWNAALFFKSKGHLKIEGGKNIVIPQWYAPTADIDGCPVQHKIDPHYVLANNRAHVCAHGLTRMGISQNAWVKVAEDMRQNGTGLSLELVNELRDHQRHSYAATTFSLVVEEEMKKKNNFAEAAFT